MPNSSQSTPCTVARLPARCAAAVAVAEAVVTSSVLELLAPRFGIER